MTRPVQEIPRIGMNYVRLRGEQPVTWRVVWDQAKGRCRGFISGLDWAKVSLSGGGGRGGGDGVAAIIIRDREREDMLLW